MKPRNRHSNLEFINTLRGELSQIDIRISNLSLNQTSSKLTLEHRNSLEVPKSLPPLSTQRFLKKPNPTHPSRIFKSLDPGCYKEIQFLESYFNLPHKAQQRRKSHNTQSKPKFFKSKPKILPKATRQDPVTNPALITEEDMQKGIYSLVNLGIATKNSEIFESLNRQNPPLVHHKVLFHNSSIQFEPLIPTKKSKKKLNFIFSEPLIPSKKSTTQIIQIEEPKALILTIIKGFIVKDENFAQFRATDPKSSVFEVIKNLENASKQFDLPPVFINSKVLVNTQLTDFEECLKVPDNSEEVLQIVLGVREEEQEKVKKLKAALKIQSLWRRFKGAARMRRHKLEKGKVRIIESQFKNYKKKLYTQKFAANLREARSAKFSQRQDLLKSNWPSLQHKPLTFIHIGSHLSSYPIPNNSQLSRLFLLVDPSISLYYITLQDLDIDIKKYFEFLMSILEVNIETRLKFIRPYTLCKTLMSDAAKALYLSFHDLVDLKYMNKDKDLLYVPFETNEYDELVAEFLKIPIMGTVSSVFHKCNKRVRWELIQKSSVLSVRGESGVWTFEEFSQKNSKFTNPLVWVKDQEWTGEHWNELAEVVIQEKPKKIVLCCLLLDPIGVVTQNISVEVNPGGTFTFPQSVLNPSQVLETITILSQFLFNQGIFGYVSVKLCSEGVIDFELGFNNNFSVNVFFNQLMKGFEIEGKYFVAKQKVSDLEQEMYIDENTNFVVFEDFKVKYLKEKSDEKEQRVYVWVPNLFSQGLKGGRLNSIFHMCRLESVLFSLSKGLGVIFLPYGSLENGCIGVLGIGEDLENALEFVAQGIFVLGIGEEGKGNLNSVAEELGISDKVVKIQKDSEKNQLLLKLL